MENEAKANAISRRVDPQERVTVDFEDEKDLNAEVTRCNTNIVTSPHWKRLFRMCVKNYRFHWVKWKLAKIRGSTREILTSRSTMEDCD